MRLTNRIYAWARNLFSRPDERYERSGGAWSWMVRHRAAAFCACAEGKLLEVGCGEGLFLARLAEISPSLELYGVDNDLVRMKGAEKRFADKNLGIPHLSLEEAPGISFPDGYFDAVVCVNTFFNMPSIDIIRETLKQMRRVCKDGGRIIIDYRNARNKFVVLKYRLARYYDETVKDLPLQTFEPEIIEGMLAETGFRAMRRAYIPSLFSRLRFLRNVAPIVVIEAEKI